MIELGENRARHRHDLLPGALLPHRDQQGEMRRSASRPRSNTCRPTSASRSSATRTSSPTRSPSRPICHGSADPQAPHPAAGGERDLPRHQEHRRARAHPHHGQRGKGQSMVIRISDNGVGMAPEQLAALRDGLIEPRPGNGVGVRNVQERIRRLFRARVRRELRERPRGRHGGHHPHPDDRGRARHEEPVRPVPPRGGRPRPPSPSPFSTAAPGFSARSSAAPRKVDRHLQDHRLPLHAVLGQCPRRRRCPRRGLRHRPSPSAGRPRKATCRARSTSCSRPSGEAGRDRPGRRGLQPPGSGWHRRSSAAASRSSASTRSQFATTPTCASARTATRAGRSARRRSCATCTPGTLVAIMSYVKGSSTAIDRESGARDCLEGKVQDPGNAVQQRGRRPGVLTGGPADRADAGPARHRRAERPDGSRSRPRAGRIRESGHHRAHRI